MSGYLFKTPGKETKPCTVQVISHPFSIRHGCLNKTLLVEKWFLGCLNPSFNPFIFNKISTISGHFQASSYMSVPIHRHCMNEYTSQILAAFQQWVKVSSNQFCTVIHVTHSETKHIMSTQCLGWSQKNVTWVLWCNTMGYLSDSLCVRHLFISDFSTFHI